MLKLTRPGAEVFIPDGASWQAACARVTHLVVAAHADDVEIMAWHALLHAERLAAVIVTDGRDSATRLSEQKQAASRGRYAAVIWLDHASAEVKQPACPALAADLNAILAAVRTRWVYTHNPADRHDTHVAVALHTVRALRANPSSLERVLGCEVWRALDWLQPQDKVTLDVSSVEGRVMPLIRAFSSQLAAKRYDLASAGRRRANATFLDPHAADQFTALEYAMDLTPLVRDPTLDIARWTLQHVERFAKDIEARLSPWK
ncbi:MAG TPA: PIG-L family deacetylase [Burkholderiales bacterium]|jgi:LmbE family N-acetylglucosaminyl deacetylase